MLASAAVETEIPVMDAPIQPGRSRATQRRETVATRTESTRRSRASQPGSGVVVSNRIDRRPGRVTYEADGELVWIRDWEIGRVGPQRGPIAVEGVNGLLTISYQIDASWRSNPPAEINFPGTPGWCIGVVVSFSFEPYDFIEGLDAYQWEQSAVGDDGLWAGDAEPGAPAGLIPWFDVYTPAVPFPTPVCLQDYPMRGSLIGVRPESQTEQFRSEVRATEGPRAGETIAQVAWSYLWHDRTSAVVLYILGHAGISR